MQQKLITFAVPCYNSAAYMRHCIETLLSAGAVSYTHLTLPTILRV